ncbi:maleylpyruvate isomerase family mycothiol-dependent enzyme [Luteimicrobium sp. NPDC057192]|uniref:maleylpyruvate isomerase family mycothiol-dependent enzyme n=1 Tax=Luteimicrobium sp. NPDC057192 TaxID=3346042 RepID=UPI00362C00CA
MRDAFYEEAGALFVGLVARVPDDAWQRPALGAWDVRDLVGHTSRSFVTVLTYLDERPASAAVGSASAYYVATTAVLASSDPGAIDERARAAGRALGDDPLAAVGDLRDRTLARLADAGPDDLMASIVGGIRVRDYLPTRVLEFVVHSRDLARALGLELTVPTTLLRAVALLAAEVAVDAGQADVVVDALLGRGTLPAGFSLV